MNTERTSRLSIMGGSIVVLHRNLKDEEKARIAYSRQGKNVSTEPLIAIDLSKVLSVQEDFKSGGSLIVDVKGSVQVIEPFDEVLEVWLEVKSAE